MKLHTLFGEALRMLFHRSATRAYPEYHAPIPPRLHGRVHWSSAHCTGCALCVKDCPANALELITLDKATKQFKMQYALDRCIFCGQCAYACRFQCITLDPSDWELAFDAPPPTTTGPPDPLAPITLGHDDPPPHA